MTNIEFATKDADIASFTAEWTSNGELFLKQSDTKGHQQVLILWREEAPQLIAALHAFIEGKDRHYSDCALHNGPAMEVEPCCCGGRA